MTPPPLPDPVLGVVIASFETGDVLLDCLATLLCATSVRLEVVVVDNASTDGTAETVRLWADGQRDYHWPADLPFEPPAPLPRPFSVLRDNEWQVGGHRLSLIEQPVNGGFARAVNAGLAALAARSELDRFWVLNPDSVVPGATPQAFATAPVPAGGFALMGGRVAYYDTPDLIQIDGGLVNWRTGVTSNANQGKPPLTCPAPDPAALDFITGASMVVSRAFYDAAGPMPESYFLYYEEVDWALRRGALPLTYCDGGLVYHRAGSVIGSPAPGRPASPFSLYFKHRGRIQFLRRFRRRNLPFAQAFTCAKAAQLLLKGYPREAWSVLIAAAGGPPPAQVRSRLSQAAARLAFARPER